MAGRAYPELLERERQLEVLAALCDSVAASGAPTAGGGGLAVVVGAPGVGKTTLLRRAAELGRERGLAVATATAGQLRGSQPYDLVRRLLDRHLMALGGEQLERLRQGPARFALAVVLGDASTAPPVDDVAFSLFWLLDALAARGPMALILDDAQWADEPSLHLMASLAPRLHDLPVVVVVATREVAAIDRGPALAELLTDGDAVRVRLAPLSPDAAGLLLERRWGREVVPEVAAAAHAATDGNPFLLVALSELLDPDQVPTAAQVEACVPDDVVDAVVARLGAMSPASRTLAEAVAVLDLAPWHVALALAGLSPEVGARAADALRRAALFAEGAAPAFRHPLLRAAAYASIERGARDALHRCAAALLAESDPQGAAAHLLHSQGVRDPAAVQILRLAADQALADGAPAQAIALLERAIAEPPTAAVLAAVLVELGLAQLRAVDPRCVDTLRRAEELTSDPGERTRVAEALASAYAYAGFHELAADTFERALAVVGGADPEADLVLEAGLVSSSLMVPERVAAARALLARRPAVAGATRGERLFAIQQMSDAAGIGRPASEIRRLAHLAIGPWDTPEQSPETTEWVWARHMLSALGDYEEVRRLTDEGFAKAAASGSTVGLVTTSFVRGFAECWGGRFVEAEEHFRALLDHGASLNGGMLARILGSGGLAHCLAMQGRVEEALEVLEPFPEQLPADAPANGAATLWIGRAVAREASGDHAGALSAAEAVRDLVRRIDVDTPTWAPWRVYAIPALLGLGRVEEARAMAAEHLALCERSEVAPLIGEALRLSGLVASDADTAIALLERAVEVLSASENRFREGLARVALGSLLRRRGRRVEARTQLTQGAELLVAAGATGLAAQADAELAAAGARRARRPVSGAASLTVSERRVVELAAQGLRNLEIARRLVVSPKTVETHLTRSYRKLGITSREELAGALSLAAQLDVAQSPTNV
ncbi:AAA family ATPase [Nocardioides acrostichi]|uniref:AAA family ATPase n=1 Tax=Nocardioides acrostichi TaxID=2784339 RepID=A0A930UZT3_9ACTN|nr:LuxR family transcriptional regulator [Nocardioides acrostichi]MBF4162762.1 AAA family ATPase [Nocardioides acrostichi]